MNDGFVSRAEGKLADAVRRFRVDFRGKTVLDIGSSTGGFTEFALRAGAAEVIAVEKGTGQMVSSLREDSRVRLFEKTDVFRFRLADFDLSVPDIILADVSFLSLTKVLRYAKMELSRGDTQFLVMLKPQFEATASELSRGIVKNEKIRRGIIARFEGWLRENGFKIVDKMDNSVLGRFGNVERFYLLRRVD